MSGYSFVFSCWPQGSIETSLDHSSSLLLMGDDETDLRQRLKVNRKDFEPIPVQLLRKYIGYVRKYIHSRIGEEAAQVLQVFVCMHVKVWYVHVRVCGSNMYVL